MVIVISGMIGVGKTTVAKAISEELGSECFLECVDGNPFLENFYTASKRQQKLKRYPFLLQLYFLNKRFADIKKALKHKNNVLDRSIYEDKYFCQVNNKLARISDEEYMLYLDLFDNMMEEIEGMPKKAPDTMIYLHASWDKICENIAVRGRGFEGKGQEDYFKLLYDGYDEWIHDNYFASRIIDVDMDKIDVTTEEGKKELKDILKGIGKLK